MRSTKNVQIIDGAANCTYHIYAFTDEEFALLFPEEGQDVEFIEDVSERLSPEQQECAFSGVWTRPVRKPDARGIHGTLFYGLDYKKEYYPSKRESDVAGPPHSPPVWLSVPEVELSDMSGEDPGETGTPLTELDFQIVGDAILTSAELRPSLGYEPCGNCLRRLG